ncbi:DEAD/DEAH box helicase [Rhabdochlamydiaceae symbiont of Dictyostelium giganteum]|uniref:DEAD/DEAH box helicase n=1 Tax=Rhabdochlamydiaceae symbiont of Dictyostelium giganteum TaxID=3342349 RepID=UPI00384D247B
MEVLLQGPYLKIQELAKGRLLTWQGKKVVLDPFLKLTVTVDVMKKEGQFTLTPFIHVGARREKVSTFELTTPFGALEGGVFRFWEDPDAFTVVRRCQELLAPLSPKQLEELKNQDFPLVFQEPILSLKPSPLPLLELTDKTGGFANLRFDYGEWGEVMAQGQQLAEEEKSWETDLLETGFYRKRVGESFYFCPLDQVGKSLSFLIDLGWKVIDYQKKLIVRQTSSELESIDLDQAILLRGTLGFGSYSMNIEKIEGSFEKHTRWINLSPHHVGLLDLPESFQVLNAGEKVKGGLRFKKSMIGLLEEVVELPSCYKEMAWEHVTMPPHFQGELFPYQQKGVNWLYFLYRSGFSGLLADEMGLGKTIQTLAFLTVIKGPILIVMPVTLLSLWKNQIHQFIPSQEVYVHQGGGRDKSIEELQKHPLILTSYATLRRDLLLLQQIPFEAVILDEAQMIKNRSTQVMQAVCSLKAHFRLAITGTPIENHITDILSLFQFLMPDQTFDSPSSQTIYKKMKPFILRRTKESVNLELPEKMMQLVEVDPSEEEFASYEHLLQSRKKEITQALQEPSQGMKTLEILELILRLRQHCCHPSLVYPEFKGEGAKFNQVLIDLEEAVYSGHKVLLYSQFTTLLKKMGEALQSKGLKYAYLDGSTQDKESAVSQFQHDPHTSIFLISLKAGGVGLNLQSADYVFLYDPWWNSAIEAQAIDRAHRIGQTKRVIARKYILNHSIESKILTLQAKKEELAHELWSKEDLNLENISFQEIKELLEL